MFVVESTGLAIALCVITMLGWGSWANTQKLAGKDRWPFELYYWDYAIGVLFAAIAIAATLGMTGDKGMSALDNLRQAAGGPMLQAAASGALFNISNILLVVAIDSAGMSVAFPVGVGLALVIGTLASYLQAPKGNAAMIAAGVALVVAAMVLSALAHRQLPRKPGAGWTRGVVFASVAGCLMGFFYPQLMGAISPEIGSGSIRRGFLTPYTALVFFAIGLVVSNTAVNTVFMKAGGWSYGDYLRGTARLHSLGFLGGVIWMIALGLNVIAAGVAGPAISYALGQGATLVAAIWGVVIWREFREAPAAATPLIAFMFLGYLAGLTLIGMATL
jgi:glucose uptake protein